MQVSEEFAKFVSEISQLYERVFGKLGVAAFAYVICGMMLMKMITSFLGWLQTSQDVKLLKAEYVITSAYLKLVVADHENRLSKLERE
jgi:hypothetical protein